MKADFSSSGYYQVSQPLSEIKYMAQEQDATKDGQPRTGVYLNNAATTYPKPPEVVAAVQKALERPLAERERVGENSAGQGIRSSCRQTVADFINAKSSAEIILTAGATTALNLAIFGANLLDGHVITTAIEHNSVTRPLHHLLNNRKVRLSTLPCDSTGWVDPDHVRAAVTGDTRLVAVSYASNVTGTVQDVKSICEMAHEVDCLVLIDASQAAGLVEIDVQDLDIDMLVVTGHKSLYGIPGAGALYLRKGIELEPQILGGTGALGQSITQPRRRPYRYEAGTPNLPGYAAMDAGIRFVSKEGIAAIRERENQLVSALTEGLSDISDVTLIGRENSRDQLPILNFRVHDLDPDDVGYMLQHSFGITVRSGLHCAPLIHRYLGSDPYGTVRISPSYFTTFEEVESFLSAVRQMCGARVEM